MSGVRRKRRLIGLAALSLLLAAVGWLGVRGVLAERRLASARTDLAAAKAALLDHRVQDADRLIGSAGRDTRSARRLTSDPIWRGAAAVPLAGASMAATADLARVADDVARRVLPPASLAAGLLDSKALRGPDGTVDLALLERAQVPLTRASQEATAALAQLSTSRTGVIWPVGGATRDVRKQLHDLAGTLDAARNGLKLAPGLLGRDRPRRYFVAVQNNAEARGTGGIIGAYAIIRADRGRITREKVGTDRDFVSQEKPVVDLGPDFAQQYDGYNARMYWTGAVVTPDWQSASKIVAGLWKAQGGGTVDGVIGIDPIAMGYLLQASGPVTFDNLSVSSTTVADFVMRDEYALFEGREQMRQQVLADLAGVLFDAVLHGAGTSSALVTAIARAGNSGHLQMWSSDPEEQAVLAANRIGAALPAVDSPFLEVVSNNAAGNKADYYVRRRVRYERPRRGSARVTVRLSTTVEPGRVPAIVTGRLDHPEVAPEPGATRQIITLYVGVRCRVRSITVDGRPVTLRAGTEQGHGWASVQVEIRPSRATIVTADIDDRGGQLIYRQQPLGVRDALDVRVPYRLG